MKELKIKTNPPKGEKGFLFRLTQTRIQISDKSHNDCDDMNGVYFTTLLSAQSQRR